jgi:hypothetical protein
MALIPQTDDGLTANANTYAIVAELEAYWLARNSDISALTTAVKEAALIKAWEYTDYAFDYVGNRLNGRTQTTQFPRGYLYDCEGNLVTDIPYEIKNAQMEYAKRELDGTTLQDDGSSTGAIKREKSKIDVIETEIEYSGSGQTGNKVAYPTADNKIPKSFIFANNDNELVMY